MNKPNIFSWATSELSQDAFICWLLSWSKEEYKESNPALYSRARKFLDFIIFPERNPDDFQVETIEIRKNYKKIDVLVNINNKLVFLIENNVDTQKHDNQLKRYSDEIQVEFRKHQILKIYFKTDYIWKIEKIDVEENGYKTIDLIQVKDLLIEDSGSDIYDDFCSNIQSKLDIYKSYKTEPFDRNNFDLLKGFLYDLSLTDLGYVGFGKYHTGTMSWYIIDWKADFRLKDCHVSLEIFRGELMVKAHVYTDKVKKKDYRNMFYRLSKKFPQYDTEDITKLGRDMTILRINEFPVLNELELIDFDATLNKLKEISTNFNEVIDTLKLK